MAPFGAFTAVKYARELAPETDTPIFGDQRLAKVSGKFMDLGT
jgi:hypothetical protein